MGILINLPRENNFKLQKNSFTSPEKLFWQMQKIRSIYFRRQLNSSWKDLNFEEGEQKEGT